MRSLCGRLAIAALASKGILGAAVFVLRGLVGAFHCCRLHKRLLHHLQPGCTVQGHEAIAARTLRSWPSGRSVCCQSGPWPGRWAPWSAASASAKQMPQAGPPRQTRCCLLDDRRQVLERTRSVGSSWACRRWRSGLPPRRCPVGRPVAAGKARLRDQRARARCRAIPRRALRRTFLRCRGASHQPGMVTALLMSSPLPHHTRGECLDCASEALRMLDEARDMPARDRVACLAGACG